uniref:Reverse transcriptase domain-containing protein n=1 Tax=Cyprinus carpio carpio TaxID=630221 RepID=A0A9J8BU30_CYPCA
MPLLTNSRYSSSFDLHRGTGQGCPLSPLLFAIAIEPLAIAIRSNERIQGIWRGGSKHKSIHPLLSNMFMNV